MAALEYRVLTALLREKTFKPALISGLKEEHFKDPEARQIFTFVRDQWFSRDAPHTVPTVAAIKYRWPAFEPTAHNFDEEGPVLSLIKQMKMMAFESDVRGMTTYFNELVDASPEEAVKVMKSALSDVSYRLNSGSHMGIQDVAEMAKSHYLGVQAGAIYGIPWPWECLTEDTLGKRPGNFIVFYGRPKSMKTWLLLYCAAEDYMVNNQRVLIWSREMDREQVGLRVASLLAKVDYQLFKKGQLPPRLEKRTFDILDELSRGMPTDTQKGVRAIKILAGADAPKTVEDLAGAMAEFEPDILYADSFYHMTTSRSKSTKRWETIACLTEDIKALALNSRIPIIGTTQANRSGEKNLGQDLTEVADTDVIGREADLIIRVIRRRGRDLHEEGYEVDDRPPVVKKVMPFQIGKNTSSVPKKATDSVQSLFVGNRPPRIGAELALVLGGNREGVLEAFTIHAIPGYNFKIINTQFSSDEVKKWVVEDERAPDTGQKSEKPAYQSAFSKIQKGVPPKALGRS